FDAVGERGCGDEEVVERRRRRFRQGHRGGGSGGAKSSSTRAPLGSCTKTCQMPVPDCWRHWYFTPLASSFATVAERPVEETAMWSITPPLSSLRGRPPTTCSTACSPAYSHAPGNPSGG